MAPKTITWTLYFTTRCTLRLPVLATLRNRKMVSIFCWLQVVAGEGFWPELPIPEGTHPQAPNYTRQCARCWETGQTLWLWTDAASPQLHNIHVVWPVWARSSWASRYRIHLRSCSFSTPLACSSRLWASVTDSLRSRRTFCKQLTDESRERNLDQRNRLANASAFSGPIGRPNLSPPASSSWATGLAGLGEGTMTSSSGMLLSQASKSSIWPSAGSHPRSLGLPEAAGGGVLGGASSPSDCVASSLIGK